MIIQEFVAEHPSDARIDVFLKQRLDDLSRTYIQKLIKEGYANVNGKCIKSNYKIEHGDIVRLHIPKSEEPDIIPQDLQLDIVYEDEDVILINKPKGMVVHPAVGHYTGTLVNGLLHHCKGNLSGINGVLRPGIVHRIDMDTTGILIACKNDMAHQDISRQLKEHSIQRKYMALVHGVVKEEELTIDRPIGRHEVDRKKMAVATKNGKHAVTHVNVLERFKDATLVECRLETGRTHQIRVHMASLHHPLLGDVIYGRDANPYHLTGQTLHAMTLGFVHPRTKEYMEFCAELPEYFEELLCKLRKQNG